MWVAAGFALGVGLACVVWPLNDLVLCAYGPVLILPII